VADSSVTITPDFKRFKKWLEELIKDPKATKRVLTRGILELADRMRAYPPEGDWNRPGPYPKQWYQRQFGTRYARKSGGVGGRNTSQKLQKNWNTEIQKQDMFTASVFTAVTYAPFLYDDNQRVSWAGAHGWQSTTEIAAEYEPRFMEMVLEEIGKQLERPIP